MSQSQPIRILIAALGGEGGGVLTGWIVDAAVASGLAAQRTSVPGVAQRTGATTYYIEILPQAPSGAPIFALNPSPGRVDVLVASELLEAARAIQSGFVSPDRTLLIASTHRVYTVAEKAAMADGRLDDTRLRALALRFAKQAVLADFAKLATAAGGQVNALLLGTLAASGVLPMPADALRQAIIAGGKAVDANLRSFEAGLRGGLAPEVPVRTPEAAAAAPVPRDPEAALAAILPAEALPLALEGVRRLADYQDEAYAGLYVERLTRFAGMPGADGVLLRELSRHLALRMTGEDTIRVAQLKLRAARMERLRDEARAKADDIVRVREFLKPGPEEIFSLLPPRAARPLLAWIARRGWMERSWPMRVDTTSLWGFARLKALASLRRWRPRSLRYAEEQAWIERWLDLVARTLAVDPQAAREVVATAGLIKGYGETSKRSHANWTLIAEEVIGPMLAGTLPASHFADAVLQARLAAVADPEGERLHGVVTSVRSLPAAQRQIAAE